jgi:hypothetical protein
VRERPDLLLASENEIAEAYERSEYSKAVRETSLADLVNQYADHPSPGSWLSNPTRRTSASGLQRAAERLPHSHDLSQTDPAPHCRAVETLMNLKAN